MRGVKFVLTSKKASGNSEFNLTLRKSQGSTGTRGNYIFEAEASNENIDLQKQVVLQRALLESKDNFLKCGVISYNHLHKRRGADGQFISDPSMIIGEPLEVRTEGTKTIVKGMLYHTSDMANEIISHLKAGSVKIKASVGGSRAGVKIAGDFKNDREIITHLPWSDLALTVSPVNPTVAPVRLIKRIA